MAKNLVFVTGNVNKLKEVKELVGKDFPFNIVNKKIDLPELQGDRAFVTRSKCLEAKKVEQGPVIVEDTCLCFNALGGLPGPFIKFFLDELKNEGLYKLLKGFEDKTAEAVCTFAYHSGEDDKDVILFEGVVEGEIVEPRGEKNFGWDPCFQPKGYTKTFAEMSSEEKNDVSHRRRAIELLRKHFSPEDAAKEEDSKEIEDSVPESPVNELENSVKESPKSKRKLEENEPKITKRKK